MSFEMVIPHYAPENSVLAPDCFDSGLGKTIDAKIFGECAYATLVRAAVSEDGREAKLTYRVEGDFGSIEEFRERIQPDPRRPSQT